MRQSTVASLIDRIRRLGDYQSSVGDQSGYTDGNFYMSDQTLLGFVDIAYGAAYEELSDSDEDWQAVRVSLPITGSTAIYPLPNDFYKLRAVEVLDPSPTSGFRPLPHATVDDDRGPQALDAPRAYRLLDNNIELVPTPQVAGSGSVRLTYVPEPPTVSSSLQVLDTDAGLGDLAVFGGCRLARIREEKPFEDFHLMYQERLVRSIKSLRRRDRAAPRRLRDPRDSSAGSYPFRRF